MHHVQRDGRLSATGVVCCYTDDRWDQIGLALRSLLGQDALDQVVCVVDHNDELFARLERAFPTVRVVPNEYQTGLSGCRNTGVGVARGDVVMFLDDDAAAEPDWAERLLGLFAAQDVMVVGGRVEAQWAGGRRPRWFPEEYDWVVGCSYRGLPATVEAIRNPIGAAMAIRSRAFTIAGCFSDLVGRVGATPVGCEETEFCIRLRQRAPWSRVLYTPAASVRHHVPRSRQTVTYFVRRCFHEGRSKAVVSKLLGARDGLSSERAYAVRTLLGGVGRSCWRMVAQRSPWPAAQSGLLVLGLASAGAGYIEATVRRWVGRR